MFERRLRILLVLLALPVIGLVLRLVQLQVVDASQYRAESEHLLLKPIVYFPCLRGEITDHDGQNRLAYDAPSWNICVDYQFLNGEEKYLRTLAIRRYRGMDSDSAQDALSRDIEASWRAISEISGKSLEELQAAAQMRIRKVVAAKQAVEKRRGVQTVVAEESIAQAIVQGLNQVQQAQARERLKGFEWITVEADQRRLYAGGPAVGHLIGLSQIPQLGEVDAEDVAQQNYADVPLGRLYEYVSGDMKGVSGVEMMGERWLRGHRGRRREDINGKVDDDPRWAACDSENGKKLRLTIDLPLQQRVYEILEKAVKAHQYSTGGAAVILDVPSREVLAIVSYPSVDPNIAQKDWMALRDDQLHQPLLFRPLQMRYSPGSCVKPMLLAGALTDGTAAPNTTIVCEKYLFPGKQDAWRCTFPHGEVDPLRAIQHSCNIFFYKLGAKMKTPSIAWWMSQFGLGRESGTGFPMEAEGHLPKTLNEGYARQAAIGQAEVDATPVQIANMMATLASGVYRPVSLWADDPRPRPSRQVVSQTDRPITNAAWRLVREGMYRVVNTDGGTAFHHARLTGVGDYILVGKTGSAEVSRRVLQWFYACHLPDGTTVEEAASNRAELEAKYPGATIVRADRAASKWPPEGVEQPTHAWFTGYLTTRQHYLQSNNQGKLNVAIAVVVEYAGHGGEGAGPSSLEMMKAVLERAGEIVPPPASEEAAQ